MNSTNKPNEKLIAWKEIRSNWVLQLVTKFVSFLIIISVVIIVWKWNRMPPRVPLWYSRPWGTDQLVEPWWLFILPVGSLLIYFINLFVSMYITAEYLIFTQMLFISSLVVNLLSFITLLSIVFIIT